MEVSKESDHSTTCKDKLNESKIVYKTISGGLVDSLVKGLLHHGIFWIIVYILGYYNFTWKVYTLYQRMLLYIFRHMCPVEKNSVVLQQILTNTI